MKDLDRSEVYSLQEIKKDEVKLNQLKKWFKENYKSWTHANLSNLKYYRYIYYNNHAKEWDFSDYEDNSICALTLFEDSNLNIDRYPNLFFEQMEELKKTASKLGLEISITITNK